MDIKDLRLLIKMVTETDISEFELEGADEKIRIKRGVAPEVVHYQAPAPMSFPYAHAAPAAAAPAQPGSWKISVSGSDDGQTWKPLGAAAGDSARAGILPL